MPTPSEQKIADTLNADAGRVWKAEYERLVATVLAAAIRPSITVPLALSPEWEKLDDPGFIAQAIAASPSSNDIASVLADSGTFRAAIGAAFAEIGLKPPGRRQLIDQLRILLGAAITPQFIAQFAQSYKLGQVWRPLADLLAADVFATYDANPATAEATLLDHTLLIAFFQASQLPRARDVRDRFGLIVRGPLGLRGGLLRIVQRVSATGIIEDEPTIEPYLPPGIAPVHQRLSVVLDSTLKEAPIVPKGGGSMHRTLPLEGPVDRGQPIPNGMTKAEIEIGRTAAWKQYEYSALAFTAIASTEFLLRSAAEKSGLPPQGIGRAARDLKLPKDLKGAVDTLFGARRFNLRHKVMHGAFLEIESRRTEINMSLPFAAKLGMPTLSLNGDRFLPEAAAAHALAVLSRVEEWVAINCPLTGDPFNWTGDFMLTAAEEAFAQSWHGGTVEKWAGLHKSAFVYLRENLAAISVPVKFGLQGWVNPNHTADLFPQFAFLAIMLEPLARLTYHLAGLRILQTSMTRNDKNQDVFDLKYLMMDEHGHIGPDRIAWLSQHLSAGDAAIANDVMRLAVKSRDAFAHGAVRAFTDDVRIAYSTPMALAMMFLLEAGISFTASS
jgi:hypothetical protein